LGVYRRSDTEGFDPLLSIRHAFHDLDKRLCHKVL
jgi:hypothetical protein